MGRVFEPDELLARRPQRLDIAGCDRRVHMPIMSSEEEEHGHTNTWHGAFEVQAEEFQRHRAERYVNSTMDGYEFPRRHEAGDHTPDDHTNLARLLVKNRAILIH